MPIWRMIRGLLADRTSQTLLLAAVVLTVFRAPFPADLHEPRYFDYQKLMWKGNADVVILGDSRTLVGLSPGLMATELKGLRIRNFAFGGVGYSDDYLAAAESVLDTSSGRKIALLGITSRSLRMVSIKSNQFISCSKSLTIPTYSKSRWFGWVKKVWPPLDRPTLDQIVFGARQKYFRSQRTSDGWSEPQEAHIDYSEALNTYRHFKSDPIRDDIIQQLLYRVRDWSRQGVHVYAFRPPTCDAMDALEDDFAEAAFIRAFEDAGGRWLSPSHRDLSTYDASHLDRPSARVFSTRVGQAISVSEQILAEQSAQSVIRR